MKWPVADPNSGQSYANRPIAFLAQIDCSEIPDFDGRSILPEEGTLFFFYNTCEWDYYPGEEPLGRVIYYPESVKNFAPRRPPDDFVQYEPESHEDRFPWKHVQGETSDCYTRWDVDLCPFIDQVVTDPDLIDEYGGQIMFEEIARVVGGIPADSKTPEVYRFFGDLSEGVFSRTGCPFSWVQVEIIVAKLRYQLNLKGNAYLDDPNTGPAARRFIEESDHWLTLARQNGRFTRPAPEYLPALERYCRRGFGSGTIDEFHLWHHVRTGLTWGADLCVAESAEAARLVPDRLIELLRPWHMPARQYPGIRYGVEAWTYDFPTHQILGYGHRVQDRPQGLEDHLLLLQLETDGHHFSWGDVGNIHYLITEADLRARRFDEVAVVMAGH